MTNNYSSKKRTPKCALYVRVSTIHQVDRDSLPIQREDLINYSKFVLNIPDYEIFEDAGFSGKNTDRPRFQEMMSRIRSGEFTHLLVWKIDRISRNLLDFSQMYAELKKLGIVFISKNEQFDTSNAMGEAMLKIILVFAELERNMTSERVSAVMVSKASSGDWNGGKIPYGYDYDFETKSFTINDIESAIVKQIYSLYLSNKSVMKTVFALNNLNIRTRQNNPWTSASVYKILKSPFYSGTYLYNVHDEQKSNGNASTTAIKQKQDWVTFENHHPAIISPEMQADVLSILSKNNKSTHRSPNPENIYIFANLIFCGNCDSHFVCGKFRKNKYNYRPSYYVCSHHKTTNSCPNGYIHEKYIFEFVFTFLANLLKLRYNHNKRTSLSSCEKALLTGKCFSNVESIDNDSLYLSYLSTIHSSEYLYSYKDFLKNENPNDEKSTLLSQRQKHERAIKRWDDLYAYDNMPIADYLKKHKEECEALEQIDKRLTELNSSLSPDSDISSQLSFSLFIDSLTNEQNITYDYLINKCDEYLLKDFANLVIDRIYITDNQITQINIKNGISYKFNYQNIPS